MALLFSKVTLTAEKSHIVPTVDDCCIPNTPSKSWDWMQRHAAILSKKGITHGQNCFK